MSNRTQLCEIRQTLFVAEAHLGAIRRPGTIAAFAAARLARAEALICTARAHLDDALRSPVDGSGPGRPGMAAPLTPGAYIKHRRTAALLSIEDVAAQLGTAPHPAEHERVAWLKLVEADAVPLRFDTVVALRRVLPFDLGVLETLAGIQLGQAWIPPRLCRICACSQYMACTNAAGLGCAWVEHDLCSACAPTATASRAGSVA